MRLPREAVELMLRAFEQGPKYGLLVLILRASVVKKASGVTMISTTFNCEGRTHVPKPSTGTSAGSGSRLIVRTRYQIEVDLEQSIRAQIEGAKLMGCGHQSSLEQNAIVTTVDKVVFSVPQVVHLTTCYSCRTCPTDLEITVRRIPGEFLASIAVEAWRDFGGRGYYARGVWEHKTGRLAFAVDFLGSRIRVCIWYTSVERGLRARTIR